MNKELRFELSFIALVVLVFLFCIGYSHGQTDAFIASGSVSPYVTLGRGLVWGGQGFQTIGQNFIFHPVDANEGFCLFVYNNNPTSAHSFSVTVAQTGDPAIQTYQNNTSRWTTVATTTAFPISVGATTLVGINYKTTASAGIAISFTGNTTQAGSPDTADVFTVQTNQSACGTLPTNAVQGAFQNGASITSAQQFPVLIGGVPVPGSTSTAQTFSIGTQGNGFVMDGFTANVGQGFLATTNFFAPRCVGTAGTQRNCMLNILPFTPFGNNGRPATQPMYPGGLKTNLLEMATDLFEGPNATAGFSVFGSLTNPGAGTTLLHQFLQANSTLSAAYKNLLLSCSAACELQVFRTTAQGTTCTALTAQNLNLWTGSRLAPATQDVAENACTGAPTQNGQLFDIFLSANATFNVDLSGYVNANTTTGAGIMVKNVTAIASGVITATLNYAEQ